MPAAAPAAWLRIRQPGRLHHTPPRQRLHLGMVWLRSTTTMPLRMKYPWSSRAASCTPSLQAVRGPRRQRWGGSAAQRRRGPALRLAGNASKKARHGQEAAPLLLRTC